MKLFFYYAFCSVKNQLRKLFKTWVAVFFAVCLLFGVLIGLGAAALDELASEEMPPEEEEEEAQEEVQRPNIGLTLYAIKDEKMTDEALKAVEEKVSNYCVAKYKTAIKLHFFTEAEYQAALDAEYADMENLYNCIGGKSLESEIMEDIEIAELLESFTDIQKDIMKLKLEGYSNKEIYVSLGIGSTTFYKEMQKIKALLMENLVR